MRSQAIPKLAALLLAVLALFAPASARAQEGDPPQERPRAERKARRKLDRQRPAPADQVLIPQLGVLSPLAEARLVIEDVRLAVDVIDARAATVLEIRVANRGREDREAELFMPAPRGFEVEGLALRGEPDAASQALSCWRIEGAEAREQILSLAEGCGRAAPVEFYGAPVLRSQAFVVPARSQRSLRLAGHQELAARGQRFDYIWPRSESLAVRIPWSYRLRLSGQDPIAALYSPSHELKVQRHSPRDLTAVSAAEAPQQPGSFRFSFLRARSEVAATLFAYPEAKDRGLFLLLAGLPKAQEAEAIRRELTLVIDRSGSMDGEKLGQVQKACSKILGGLRAGEAFNIIDYNHTVASFAKAPVDFSEAKLGEARGYLKGLAARGGTNIHDALAAAVSPEPRPGLLPIVLFLTDGLPTMGPTSESAIFAVAGKRNRFRRRLFTIGVGLDVNTALLRRMAKETRGRARFVLPGQDPGAAVSAVFEELSAPTLTAPSLTAVNAEGQPDPQRLSALIPAALPDLYGDDLLVVLGRYTGAGPLKMRLSGNYLGEQRSFALDFKLDKASAANAFVARLWASRRIAQLSERARDLGARSSGAQGYFDRAQLRGITPDPRRRALEPLVAEIVQLATRYGVHNAYTAFLASETQSVWRESLVMKQAQDSFYRKAIQERSGKKALSQELQNGWQEGQCFLNPRNRFLDPQLKFQTLNSVQQVADRAFYRRDGAWLDSRLLSAPLEPARVIPFASPDYRALLRRLDARERRGILALEGPVTVKVDGEILTILNPSGADQKLSRLKRSSRRR